MKNPRNREKTRNRILAMLAIVLAGWLVSRGVVAANRHQLSHPTRALASPENRAAFEHGFTTQDLLALLSQGSAEGVTRDGTKITLALDEELQQMIFSLFRRFDPPYGVFAAMEPDNGRVVALVGYRKGGEPDPRLALKAVYPAASLIKVVTASAALENGKISPEDEISYRGGIYRITRRGIHAKDGRGAPSMSLEEAIARSANSVFGKVTVNYVGSESLSDYMMKFGFCQPIPFDLPVEESTCEVPRDEYNLARTGAGFGEVYVSPLHMAMIMSAIASSGDMPQPILIERVEDKDGHPLFEAEPSKWRDTVKPETADALLRMMVKTIEAGTSRRTFGSPESTPLLQDMEVAGKTGSLSGWTPRMHFEWFAGVAPVGDPKLAVAALVVNDSRWKIKGSYVGKEAFNTYFGYPSSTPPVYAKARKKARLKSAARKSGHAKARASRKRKKKASPPASGVTSPRRNAPVG
ncbi:MAG TPA: penicillin-binding transpeptidase domain-containing protein [Candidatus Limnocylindrales bacterium]|nr:penicillin-binding transpeptidase domain-containing protein [Candidatus Limnocylindrales bacterium]